MKTDSYTKAIDNIYNRIGHAVVQGIPTLDHIMGVENMSEADKIWYEAYKKYGNRNHTWQDFRDMFYGDVDVMQKTVVHWKTWDEINDTLSQAYDLVPEIRRLMREYGINSINVTKLEEYKQYPDLVSVCKKYREIGSMAYQNYSTFNPQIAKLEKAFEKKSKMIAVDDKKAKIDLIVEYLEKMDEYVDLQNGDFVVAERIETYREIILKDQQILKLAKDFDKISGSQKVDLARMILNKSAKITGTPTGQVIQDDAPAGPHVLTGNQVAGYVENRKEFLFRGDDLTTLWTFLKYLVHEDAHRIDYYNAEYGMIGTQLMKFVNDNYVNNADIDVELYRKFATEQSSYYLDRTTASALEYAIMHQSRG
ncbi:MAG: hypothetical protein K2L94_03985 [Alphaproteobacteria bacterium]|nr:hypothetical protein [Alphaproteobacteria bacterium]